MILVTGGAGFIGANFIHDWLARANEPVVNLDALTYAGNLHNLRALVHDPRHVFVRGDITDRTLVDRLLTEHRPRAIVHFAAETHVDRAIDDPAPFLRTNVQGTYTLLEAARDYWRTQIGGERTGFRFLHVGTDEVYGALGPDDAPFTEAHPVAPNNPYAASKAAADHLVRAWHRSYGLPTLVTHCSNNYGPYQFPEKFIPLMIVSALAGRPLPVYGDGLQVRDWLYVGDHCAALRRVLEAGRPGETYHVGGGGEQANLDVVRAVCALLDTWAPARGLRHPVTGEPITRYAELVTHVTDRPGHDRRYAIDAGKLARELDWRPAETFETGLAKTVRWYLGHPDWVRDAQSGAYRDWVDRHYADREGRP